MKNNNIIDFTKAKKRFITTVVYVGDIVEWQDYNGTLYEGIVEDIQHKPLDGFTFSEKMDCFPLWEKEEYSITFTQGLQVIGDAITQKVIRKNNKPVNPFNPYTGAGNGH